MTTFQANFINVPTSLSAGQKLTYKFALQGTPIKPRQRTAWQWRIARHEPWGRIFELPDRETGGMPRLEYFRQAGIRHLFYRVADIWPYPLPVNEPFARQLQRAIDRIHASGLKLYPYLIHQRFPTVVPEFDLNGLHLAKRPTRWYVQASAPGIDHPRPGPLVIRYGSNSQGALLMCAKSMALQDAYVDSLARRLDQFGDDGVYLDGTAAIVPCANLLHGCGYRTADGTIKPTHPAFGVRQFMKRIFTVVKQRRPHGIVDVHASFGQNFSALAYGDVLWTGEHWWHLRHEGAEHVATELPMDMFRTEFTGVPSGVAAETLSYRLGSRMQVAAISLLYDIPVRLNTRLDQDKDKRYFEHLTQLWKVRERFGAEDDVVERLLYYENQDYVTVSPEHCHATLLRHPENGVLAVVSNLQAEPQMVSVRFDLDRLQVRELNVRSYNALTDEYLEMDSTGQVRLSLDSLQWKYIWLRPRVCCGG